MNPLEILQGTKQVLATPEKWTKGSYYRDKNNCPLSAVETEKAVCFCSIGAIRKASHWNYRALANGTPYQHALALYSKALTSIGRDPYVVDFNDAPETTFEDLHIVLDKAIELAKKEQA